MFGAVETVTRRREAVEYIGIGGLAKDHLK